jgi:hypothetical protein
MNYNDLRSRVAGLDGPELREVIDSLIDKLELLSVQVGALSGQQYYPNQPFNPPTWSPTISPNDWPYRVVTCANNTSGEMK